jgi:hypothetical protein
MDDPSAIRNALEDFMPCYGSEESARIKRDILAAFDGIVYRVKELGRENQIIASQRDTYRDAVSTLEVQGVTGMVEDWVCVPASEWWQVFEKLNQP